MALSLVTAGSFYTLLLHLSAQTQPENVITFSLVNLILPDNVHHFI